MIIINEPESVLLKNNNSAFDIKYFIEKAFQELIDASIIKKGIDQTACHDV